MMNWLFFALLAPAVLTITIFTDKYIVGNAVKDYRGVVLMQALMGFFVGTFFWIATGFPRLGAFDACIVLTSGILTIFAGAFYFKALKEEEASYIIFMLQMIPIFVMILSFLLLKETISLRQLLGFCIVLLSAMAVAIDDWKKIFHFPKLFWTLIIMDFLFALASVLVKFAINATSFAQILSYESWGISIGGIFLYAFIPHIRKAFHEIVTTVGKRILGVMFLNEGIYVLSKSLSYFAYSIGPVALVSVIGSTQIFFGIFAGWILTLILPHLFNEKISRHDLFQKVGFALLMIVGIILIF
jgi:transporter family protein